MGAVAVVDVPVQGGDPLNAAVGQGVHGGNGDIAKDAESAPAVAFGVVAGRADQGVGVVDGAVQDGVDGDDCAAGSQEGDFVAARVRRGRLRPRRRRPQR